MLPWDILGTLFIVLSPLSCQAPKGGNLGVFCFLINPKSTCCSRHLVDSGNIAWMSKHLSGLPFKDAKTNKWINPVIAGCNPGWVMKKWVIREAPGGRGGASSGGGDKHRPRDKDVTVHCTWHPGRGARESPGGRWTAQVHSGPQWQEREGEGAGVGEGDGWNKLVLSPRGRDREWILFLKQ